uniref:Ovule protein n=1 Tax=Brugia timori TaxID=42155 RepID=A0A0R3R2R9_9BILA
LKYLFSFALSSYDFFNALLLLLCIFQTESAKIFSVISSC